MMLQEEYVSDAVDLLKKLIATPSVSRNEKDAADIMVYARKSIQRRLMPNCSTVKKIC